MDENDTLRSLWEETLAGEDLEGLDPLATFKGADAEIADASFDSLNLPLFKVADDASLPTSAAQLPADESQAGGHATLASSPPQEPSAPPGDDDAASMATVDESHLEQSERQTAETAPTLMGHEGPPPEDAERTDLEPTRYELQEVIGRGGMGVVYRALQSNLGREVAVKRILTAKDPRRHEKFIAEAMVTARLDHPNVVPVHDLGVTPFGDALLAMKLVEGDSWKHLLHPKTAAEERRSRSYGLPEHLRILISVCNAVAYAHSRGVVHLDLKPENIMLGGFGEVLVMDWGLAVDIRDAPPAGSPVPHKTSIKAPCGTPAYMAPELAKGKGDQLGTWTDVYLLGAILHELITGKPPHRANSTYGVVLKAATCDPPVFPDDTPEELQVICRKCMAKDPAQRFQRVEPLRQSLEEFLQHRESRAIATSATRQLERAQAGARGPLDSEQARNQVYTDFAAAVAGFQQAQLLWADNEDAQQKERAAQRAYSEAALAQGDLGLAESLLAATPSEEGSDLRAKVAEAKRARAASVRHGRILRWTLGAALLAIVAGLSVGYALVSAARTRAEQSEQEAIAQAREAEKQRDLAEAERARAELERARAEARLAESLIAEGNTLGKAGRWNEARQRFRGAQAIFARVGRPSFPAALGLFVADRRSPRPLLTLEGHKAPVRAIAFMSDGRRLVSGDAQGVVRVWDTLLGRVLHMRRAHQAAVLQVAASPGGVIASAAEDGGVQLRTAELKQLHELPAGGPVTRLAFSPDGATLLTAGRDRAVKQWNASNGVQLGAFPNHGAPVSGLAWMPNNIHGLTATAEGELKRWYVPKGSVYWSYRRAPRGITDLAYDGKQSRFALALQDHTVRLWTWHRRYNNFAESQQLKGHTGAVRSVAFTPDGLHLLSAGGDGRLIVWRVHVEKPAEQVASVSDPSGDLLQVAISPRGTRVAAASRGGVVLVWDLGLNTRNPTGSERNREVLGFLQPKPDKPRPRFRKPPPPTVYSEVALSPDGLLAAAASSKGAITLWEAQSGLPLVTLPWHKTALSALRFQGNDHLFSASEDGAARLWKLDGLTPLHTLQAKAAGTKTPAAISPEGKRVAFGLDTSLHVLELASGKPRLAVQTPVELRRLAWRGELLAAGARNGDVRLWTDAGRTLLGRLRGSQGAVGALSISPSQALVLAGGAEGSLRLIRARPKPQLGPALPGHTDRITQVEFASERHAISASADGSWRVWDTERARELRSFDAGLGPVRGLSVSPGGDVLASGAGVRRWALLRANEHDTLREETRQALAILQKRPDQATARATLGRWYAFRGEMRAAIDLLESARRGGAKVSALLRMRCYWEQGHYLAALRALKLARASREAPKPYLDLCRQALLRLQDLEGSRLTREPDRVHAVAFTPDGRLAISTSDGKAVNVWDPTTGQRLRMLRGHLRGIMSLAVAPDGEQFASGDRGGTIIVWETATGRLLRRIKNAHKGYVNALAYVPSDGGTLVSCGYDKTLKVWDSTRGTRTREFSTDRRPARCLAVSPDGKQVATNAGRGLIQLWDLTEGTRTRSWKADKSEVRALAFGKGGKTLLSTGYRDKALKVWDAASGNLLSELPHPAAIHTMAYDPRTQRAVTVGRQVRVWDLTTGKQVKESPQPRLVFTVALSPQGAVLTGGRFGNVILRTAE